MKLSLIAVQRGCVELGVHVCIFSVPQSLLGSHLALYKPDAAGMVRPTYPLNYLSLTVRLWLVVQRENRSVWRVEELGDSLPWRRVLLKF